MIIAQALLVTMVTADLVTSSPFVALVRPKRTPNNRAMTWSGWMPGKGMTLFASAAEDQMFGAGLKPPGSSLGSWYDQSPTYWKRDPFDRRLFAENDGPATTLRPFNDEEFNDDGFKVPKRGSTPFDDERDRRTGGGGFNDNRPSYGRRNKPRRYNKDNDYDDEEDDRRSSGSNANASFNAWFPIVLGMYPGEGGTSSRSANRNRSNYGDYPAQGVQHQPQQPQGDNNNDEEDAGNGGRSLAAIANSVNHGRSGVASSHAVIYTGQPRYSNQRSKLMNY